MASKLSKIRYRMAQGSALLSALFIMTLVAIAATAMSSRLQLDIYRTKLTINSEKLYLASQGVTFWAMSLVQQDAPNSPTPIETPFPHQLKSIYPGVIIQGKLIDLQAQFNVNNLQDSQYFPMFEKIVQLKIPSINTKKSKALLSAINHWLLPHNIDRGQDQYLSSYLKQSPPYLPGYQPLTSVSELRLIKGVNAKIFSLLSPSLTALPTVTPINIYTAPESVLMSLGDGLTKNQANEIIQTRTESSFKATKDMIPLLNKFNIPKQQVTLESSYFLCIAVAKSEEESLTNYILLKRKKDKNSKFKAIIIAESLNTQ